jgi:hypothetical protein
MIEKGKYGNILVGIEFPGREMVLCLFFREKLTGPGHT